MKNGFYLFALLGVILLLQSCVPMQRLTVHSATAITKNLHYNPDIANTLFRCGDIDVWGRGYRKIVKSVLEHKQLPPVIKDMGGLMLTYFDNTRTQLKNENVDDKTIQFIEYVIDNGSINNSEVQKLLNISKPTATRLLKQSEKWLKNRGNEDKGQIM